jgi:hypothetical protein
MELFGGGYWRTLFTDRWLCVCCEWWAVGQIEILTKKKGRH